jgi:hypothetical protein
MTHGPDRVLSPSRVSVSTTLGRVCLCLLTSYLAMVAALASVGRDSIAVVGPSPWVALSPISPAYLIFASVLLGLSGAPTLGLFVYPVVLTFYILFVCGKLHWGWLGVPFALMWLELHRLVIVIGEIVGC